MYHHTRIEINAQQLINNIKLIKEFISTNYNSKPKYCLPIKANAYGHGLVGVANIVQHEVDYFGVAVLDEGIKLRSAGIIKPILVFGAFVDNQIEELIYYNLELTVSSLYKAKLVADFCTNHNCVAKVHVKVDTGMNRVGVRVDSANELLEFILSSSCFELKGVYSHLAKADIKDDACTKRQISEFAELVKKIKIKYPQLLCHLANSGGILNYAQSIFDMVRPGILSYGYMPDGSEIDGISGGGNLIKVLPCFSLYSNVTYFKVAMAGQGISYNHEYITKNVTRIITIPIGYGDGYRRALSDKGRVIVRGKSYRISGIICMDMLMVDIGMSGEAYVGDEVVLIGRQGDELINIEDIARDCGTVSYEILCGFNERIPRVYI